jgi:hypothetical protein
VNVGPTVTRGVVEMHTYKLLGGINDWVDSTSQSITLELAGVDCCGNAPWPDGGNWRRVVNYGQQLGATTCRVNGSGGSVSCSVPNTYRVAFYSPQIGAPNFNTFVNVARTVSWRDDRGVAHRNVQITLPSPIWSA